MIREQLTTDYQKAKALIQSSTKLTQVEKDVAVFRRWRVYINAHTISVAKEQEAATISITT
jgi:hypothetical protein